MHIYPKNTSIKPMKATDYNKVVDKWKPSGQFIIEQKYDGARVIIHCIVDKVELYSGNGHRFHFPKLEEQIIRCLNVLRPKGYSICMLDGELCYGEGKSEDRSSISGRLNKALHGAAIQEHENIFFHCFDILELKYQDAMLNERLKTLECFKHLVFKDDCIKISTPIIVRDYLENPLEYILKYFNEHLAEGHEGVMIKRLTGKYEVGKRSKNWLKLKAENTIDLECFGVEKGTGKYSEMIGALLLRSRNTKYFVKVGSGLTDADRAKSPSSYIGKIIEIKYNCLTENSFFLPIFKRIRLDKTEADNV